jgi:hypothetical protein
MFAIRNRLSDHERNIGIQNGFVIKDAVVVHRYSAIFQMLNYDSLQMNSGIVSANGNCFHSYPPQSILGLLPFKLATGA